MKLSEAELTRVPRGFNPEGQPWYDDDGPEPFVTGPRWALWNYEARCWDALEPGRDFTETVSAHTSADRLAEALPSHRHCDEHIRGHQACLDEARAILRNLDAVEEATRP